MVSQSPLYLNRDYAVLLAAYLLTEQLVFL